MSGTASVANTFNSAVTATGLQLDTNYNNLTAYLNDPTNRNNFVTDTGNTNTIVLTFSPAVAGYTTGLEISFKAANTNSGASVVNVNALGNKNLVYPDGSTLVSSAISIGSVYDAIYDGTQFVGIGFGIPATAAQVSAAANIVNYVSPAKVQNHPGVSKAWANFLGTSTGTITAQSSYNVGSIVRQGTGTYSISFSTSFANTFYAVIATSGGAGNISAYQSSTKFVGSVVILTFTGAGVASDSPEVNFTAFGNQ